MKAVRQRFHKEIVRQYKLKYFANARKELLQHQEFQLLFQRVIDSEENLIILVDSWGLLVFLNHVHLILNQKLYGKLYHHSEKYFLKNLNFLLYLLQMQVLPAEHIEILISRIAEVLKCIDRIYTENCTQIFLIIEKILTSNKYLQLSLEPIMKNELFPKLYEIIIGKEINEQFFKLIQFWKYVGYENVIQISDQQKINCLQIHILTSSNIEQLYTSYSTLADIFQKLYTDDQELYEYGSILDKTMKDITIDRLIDPISYFLVKAFNNHSIKKLAVEIGYVEKIFEVILNNLFMKNNISIFGHQSIWSIFRKIIQTSFQNSKIKINTNLDWICFKQRLLSYQGMKYPYLKNQVDKTLDILKSTKLKNTFMIQTPRKYAQIAQQLQQVQI